MFWSKKSMSVIDENLALEGRFEQMVIEKTHFVSGAPLKGPHKAGAQTIYFAMGCFWGAERVFWQLEGVLVTAVGYQGGFTPNPTYEEVCSGHTGHTEAVMVVFDPKIIDLKYLLKIFWERHDPTQGMGQGNDKGTQYRSAIYTTNSSQKAVVTASTKNYAAALSAMGKGTITTEIGPAKEFYFAETHHQQYLAKNPGGYCGLAGTGVSCQIPQG